MRHDIIVAKNYLLVVSKERPQLGDYMCILSKGMRGRPSKYIVVAYDKSPSAKLAAITEGASKIIAHDPLNGAPYLDPVDVLPPTWRAGGEEESVEQLAQKEWGNVHRTGVLGFMDGCKKTREKYKFTEEDILDAWELGAKEGLPLTRQKKEDLFNSLRQAKLPVAFEREMKQRFEGDKSKRENPYNGVYYTPKTITNAEGRTEWVGDWIFEQPKPNVNVSEDESISDKA